MKDGLRALEDQFNDTASLCFEQLRSAQNSLDDARQSVQRMFSIQHSMSSLRNGKRNVGRSSFRRAIKGLLACLLISPAMAGDYAVLVNTNLAAALGDEIVWRTFIEPEKYVVITTNWTQITPQTTDTNGMLHFYEAASVITNRTLKFMFEGKEYLQPVNQDRGPVVAIREITVPVPLPPPIKPLQLRKKK